jgi:hypothetical protein
MSRGSSATPDAANATGLAAMTIALSRPGERSSRAAAASRDGRARWPFLRDKFVGKIFQI